MDRQPAPAPDFAHAPVMLDEVLAVAKRYDVRRLVDCTAGGGGHSAALLAALPQAELLALDRDATAVAAATARLRPFGARARVVQAPFSALQQHLGQAPYAGAPDFVLADFGVSSHQLDTAGRGFSFRADGPLDMRMDPSRGASALDLLRRLDADALANIIWRLGEERYSRRIARAILQAQPTTTLQLAEVVRSQVPRGPRHKKQIDGATRTFQALRMAVNDELGEIEGLLAAVPDVLGDGGVFVALSFHSLEDRLVKHALQQNAHPCTCPPELPLCGCGRVATLQQPVRKVTVPTAAEAERNPRARSTRMRWAVRLPRAPR